MIRDQWIDQRRLIELEEFVARLHSIICQPYSTACLPCPSGFQQPLCFSPWTSVKDKLHPDKPGLDQYEHVACLVVYNGEILLRKWNCEHLVWDTEDGDDFFCKAEDITHWMPLPQRPELDMDIENEK